MIESKEIDVLKCLFVILSVCLLSSHADVLQAVTSPANPKLSLQLHSVREDVTNNFEETLRKVAQMGFEGVEFAGRYGPYKDRPQALKRFLQSINLEVSGAHLSLSQLRGEIGERNLNFLAQLDAKYIIIPHDKRNNDPEQIDEFIIELNELSLRVKSKGMLLGYHNHSSEFESFKGSTFWDYIASNTDNDFILQLDAGWVNFINEDPIQYVKRYPNRTLTTHYKIRTYKGKPSTVPSDSKVILGQDNYDWSALISATLEYGATRWIVVEQEEYPSPLTPLQSVEASLIGLQNIINGMSELSIPSTSMPYGLLVDGTVKPLNIHRAQPALSWRANTEQQHAYQIQVASTSLGLLNGQIDLWDSGKVVAKSSRYIAYQGKRLMSKDRAFWRVRVWPSGNQLAGPWSAISQWKMGLRNKADWQAKWLQVPYPSVAQSTPALQQWINLVGTVENEDGTIAKPAIEKLQTMPTASLFRHKFNANKSIEQAHLYTTAGGYYEVFLNGKKVKDRIMDPGQTDFNKRILYNTDDVSHLIDKGQNVIAVHLGSGWYNENIAFSRWKNPDGEYSERKNGSYSYGQPIFIAQLELSFTDGSSKTVVSNEKWLSHPSPVVKEGIFSGEVFDANKYQENWQLISANTEHWQKAKALDAWPTKRLEPQLLPPIKPIKKMQPVSLLNPKKNVWVFDFGQNFTGIPTIDLNTLSLESGQGIYLRFAEWADDEGNISQLSGGSWATHLNPVNAYIASDKTDNSWTPSFSWHGFRYIEISGLTEAPSINSMTAKLVRSDVKRVGHFSSSDPLINRIHNTALWTYESNLMSVPLDCPIREKAGWTGDAHAALITGNYNFNMETFWPKYLGDFKTAENIAPTVVPGKRTGAEKVDWAVAEVFIAWEHYRHHGDIQVLKNQYQSLLEYMAFGQTQMTNFLISKGYGDWCDPVRSPGLPRVGGRGTPQWTSTTVTSTALFTQAANYMSKIAHVLGKSDEHLKFSTLHNNLKKGFHEALYDPQTGHYGSQTADAMALRFEITPPDLRQSVADALNRDVLENWNGHSSVGALGQTWLYLALSDYGYTDTAFNIFKAQGYPGFSYLFDELRGTTLWERKGAFDPTSGKGPLRSLNHPFHSGYDGWFYQGLGGIRPLENSVGFQEFMLKPVFPKDLDNVFVKYDSGYGEIVSTWQRNGVQVHWQITIPQNTKAWIYLPNRETQLAIAGQYEFVINIQQQ